MNLKVLIVCSVSSGKIAPFIQEQAKALTELGVIINYFLIKQKGWKGYLKSRENLIVKINEFSPDILHAHYGLSCLLANLQRKRPVISTFHGSDINNCESRFFSQLAILLSKQSIFVSSKLKSLVVCKSNDCVIPCGVDFDVFIPVNKIEARSKMGFKTEDKLILFSNAFTIGVKNYSLAKEATEKLPLVHLIELKDYSREEVCLLLNAADVALMTSFTEGSPQFIKEAMACNCPIVSTDVGDIRQIIGGTDGCYISSYEVLNVKEKLEQALSFGQRTNGRQKVLNYDNKVIANKIIEIYKRCVDGSISR